MIINEIMKNNKGIHIALSPYACTGAAEAPVPGALE